MSDDAKPYTSEDPAPDAIDATLGEWCVLFQGDARKVDVDRLFATIRALEAAQRQMATLTLEVAEAVCREFGWEPESKDTQAMAAKVLARVLGGGQ